MRGIVRRVEETVRERFVERFGREPEVVVRAPGRVNLLGAHVDYSDGFVLPAAIDRAIWLAAAVHEVPDEGLFAIEESEPAILVALDLEEEAPFDPGLLDAETRPALPDWSRYPLGVASVLAQQGYPVPAIDGVFGGDLPRGAGVSSSAAVEVAFFLALEELGGFQLPGRDRAVLGRRVENEILGVQSGVMDQFASIHGRAGCAVLLDCRSLEHELIPVPDDLAVLVADTGVRRTLVGSSFNDRKSECVEALRRLQQQIPELESLRDLTPERFEKVVHLLPPPLDRRARHVVEECERVLAGAEALRQGDLERFGEAVRGSHRSSRDLYEVSIPELDVLAEAAWEVEGCWGARLAGGGFGGCVTCLARHDALDRLTAALERAFEARFARVPETFRCAISDGAGVVWRA